MTRESETTITYKDAGVDTQKAQKFIGEFLNFQKTRAKHPALLSGIGPYAACLSLKPYISSFKDPVLVTCCDGVGTKLKLALEWNYSQGLAQDLVAMNVNDLLCVGAKPIAFLDYYATSKLTENPYVPFLKHVQMACEDADCAFAGGETAEMPGLYNENDFDLAGFCVGVVDKEKIIGPHQVKTGDTLIAVESSGPHSNGYSLIRRLVEKENLNPHDSVPWDKELSWLQTFLKPTHLYVKAFESIMPMIHAAAHITGGGLYENLPRILPETVAVILEKNHWPIPPIFQWLQNQAKLNQEQAFSTFNMGVGMIIIADESNATTIIKHLEAFHLRAWTVGKTIDSTLSSTQITWDKV